MVDDKKSPDCAGNDLISLRAVLPNGDVFCTRHRSDHTVEGGVLRTIPEEGGVPENTEVVHLKHRDGSTYEVTESSKEGPAMVNSSAFRSGWDSIFGGRPTVGQA